MKISSAGNLDLSFITGTYRISKALHWELSEPPCSTTWSSYARLRVENDTIHHGALNTLKRTRALHRCPAHA